LLQFPLWFEPVPFSMLIPVSATRPQRTTWKFLVFNWIWIY
jgi:hypothetical protein